MLMPYNTIILYFHLPYFHVSNSALIFTKKTSGTLLSHGGSLDTLYFTYIALKLDAGYVSCTHNFW